MAKPKKGSLLGPYLDLGKVSRSQLCMPIELAARYVDGGESTPCLRSGLRIRNAADGNPNSFQIHKEDIPEFVRRVKTHLITIED